MPLDFQTMIGETLICGDWHPGKQIKVLNSLRSKWVASGGHGLRFVRPVLDLVCQPLVNPPGLAFRHFKDSTLGRVGL